MEDKVVKVFAPASVSNVGPGFDVLGFAIEGLGDTISLSKRSDGKYIINSVGTTLPLDPNENAATVALKSMAQAVGYKGGFDITIEKNFVPGSGLGSSASSASGAVFAANELLDTGFTRRELVPYALDGEVVASGNRHGDNVVPCLLGGLVAVQSCDPFEGFNIPVPEDLRALIIFPNVPIRTAEARELLPKEVTLSAGIAQSANMAGLIKGLMSGDYDLIKRSLQDKFAQPFRMKLIPKYEELESLMNAHSAFGFTISGSGPAMLSFFRKGDRLGKLKKEVTAVYRKLNIEVSFHESGVNQRGVEIVND